jgi:hypothetical protein
MKQIRALDLDFKVTFVGTYFVLSTNVQAYDEDEAIEVAQDLMKEQYGWQPDMWANDIEVEREER